MTVTSGYRTPTYNRRVGGVRRSQHIQGRAADIKIKGLSAQKVSQGIRELIRQDQVQITGLGSYRTFTHIDIRPSHRLAYWVVRSKGGK
nr:hypothetical protein 4 [bacterium]